MNNRNTGNQLMRVIAITVIAALSFLNAGATDKNTPASDIAIRFEGVVDDRPVFSVSYANTAGKSIIISIRDNEGYEMYTERSDKSVYNRKFAIDHSQSTDIRLMITVSDEKGNNRRSYQVTTRTLQSQDWTVTRI